MCLSKTKNKVKEVTAFLAKERFDHNFIVEPQDAVGGLAKGWKNTVKVKIVKHESFFIHTKGIDTDTGLCWDIIGVYYNSVDKDSEE